MKKKKNADVVETEAAEAVTEETKTSKDKKPETETAEDIEKKAEEEAAEIEAYDAEGNPILKKKKKNPSSGLKPTFSVYSEENIFSLDSSIQ